MYDFLAEILNSVLFMRCFKKFKQGHKYMLDSKKVEIVCLLFLHPE